MKLTQQVNQKASYILLGVVGGLMLLMVVWYMYGGSPSGEKPAPAPAAEQDAAAEQKLSEPLRGSMPDAAAVEQKLEEAQSQADQAGAASDAPLEQQAASAEKQAEPAAEPQAAAPEAASEGQAQQAADSTAAEAEGAAANETAEAAAAVEQGAQAAAAATDSVEQAAQEAARAIAEKSAQEAGQAKQVAESKASRQAERRKAKSALRNNKLTAINVVPTQYGVVIRLQTSVPVDNTRWDRLRSPNRVYIDMFGAFRSGVSDRDISDNPYLKKLRIGLHKDRIRVVADLASEGLPKQVKVSKGSDRVVVLELSDFR